MHRRGHDEEIGTEAPSADPRIGTIRCRVFPRAQAPKLAETVLDRGVFREPLDLSAPPLVYLAAGQSGFATSGCTLRICAEHEMLSHTLCRRDRSPIDSVI